MRFEGDSGGSKSSAMELMSYLIYGDTALKTATVASNYTDAALNPMIFLDNIETRNLSQSLEDFMITAVTGIKKEKRKSGTDRENVEETVKALINSSGIEGLKKNELINRSFIIEFDIAKYGNIKYTEFIYDDIIRNRNKILSAVFQMVSEIHERIINKDNYKIREEITKRYGNHSKSRANEFLALMWMITERLIKYFNDPVSIEHLFESWIESQNCKSQIVSSQSSQILQLLNSLKRVYNYDEEIFNKFEIEGTDDHEKGTLTFRGSSSEFFATFTDLAGKKRLPFGFGSAAVLTKRIKDSEKTLRNSGWEITTHSRHSGRTDYEITYNNPIEKIDTG